jgi:hypothetical protein
MVVVPQTLQLHSQTQKVHNRPRHKMSSGSTIAMAMQAP